MPLICKTLLILISVLSHQNHISTDIILTDGPKSIHKTSITTASLSDFHKLVLKFFKCHFPRLAQKNINFTCYKHCNPNDFLDDLKLSLQINHNDFGLRL